MLAVFASSLAHADDSFRSRPITLIAPLAPGSAGDAAMRELANEMSIDLGQLVAVKNMAGVVGNIGTAAIARSKPDEYTVGMGGPGAMGSQPVYFARPRIRLVKGYCPNHASS
ncbi:hypothetical protein CR155_11020 [Pollutimonas nitritireducens]|uniref:Tricarboxylate transport protein TctC n=1 Tax=Pollutimonas nitritireducens TaxID=2045209 RepID=A0A2N4UG02_9BURK|nr:hypothetical protein CR155_11020 [Pollutimonas nitritireducens]